MTDEGTLDSGSRAGSASTIDGILLNCESAWRRGERPGIDEVIQAHRDIDRWALLVELIHLELEQRLAMGENARVEEYLQRFPELRADQPTVLSLIQTEVEMRSRKELELSVSDYCQRFPDLVAPIRTLFVAQVAKSLETDDTQEWTTHSQGDAIGHGKSRGAHPNTDVRPESQPDRRDSTDARPLAGGRFTVLRPHARGGLGQVSVALDEELHREVALKQLQPRYAQDAEYRTRFVSEAAITGGLEHPGIVPVYGLGKDDDGCPFYAMRFIRGDSLSAAIDKFHRAKQSNVDPGERALEFRKLLARMIDVCNAVAYAHSRGVIHRDLKPANVMIGNFGETLVVDWGLAKTIEVTAAQSIEVDRPLKFLSQSDSTETRMGSTVGTLQYMSPEQAAGRIDLVSVSSDIYCLGSTLYHLLTGKPYLGAGNFHTLVHRIQVGDFDHPRVVNPGVPPALEAICLKAMAKAPSERYLTPRSLAEDIELWLADEPVFAYREKCSERIGRWLRKHRTWALAIVTALLLVSAVSISAVLLINQARRNEAIERQNAQEAKREAITDFQHARETVDTWLTGAGDALKYYPGMQQIRGVLLQQAAASYEGLAQRHDDPSLELERGRSYVRLGDVHRLLGDRPASEKAYGEGDRILGALIAQRRQVSEASIDRANVRVKRSLSMAEAGMTQEAEEELAATIHDLEAILSVSDDRAHETLGVAWLNYAMLQSNRKDFDGAIQSLDKAIRRFDEAWQARPTERRYQISKASAKSLWGQCLVGRGQYTEAIEQYEGALAGLERLPADPLADAEWLDSRAALRIGMAGAFRMAGSYSRELDSYRDAIDDYTLLDKVMPHAPPVIEGLALTRTDMGQLLHHLGDAGAAQAEYRMALDAFKSLHKDFPNIPRYRQESAATLDSLGEALRDLGDSSAAKLVHEQAINTYAQLIQDFPDEVDYSFRQAICRSHLGQILQVLGANEQASDEFQASVSLLDAASPQTIDCRDARCFVRTHQGKNLLQQGDQAGAAKSFATAIAEWQEILNTEDASPEFRNHLAWFLISCPVIELRDANRAAALVREAVNHAPDNVVYLCTQAAAKYRQHEAVEAISILGRVRQIRGQLQGWEWFFLAMANQELGNHDAARDALRSGELWMREHLPGNAELKQLHNEAQAALQGP